jgi:ATP-binding protein involved in chromosome partitioning
MSQPNPFDQQRAIPGVRRILAVSSGKGGVGKSTVAANLAVALARSGSRVGLLDADIYGPSQPRMFGLLGRRPEVDQKQRIFPLVQYGIKLMSMGFLVEESAAVIWRGPMLFKAMDQFFRDVEWGELDELVIDLPPGTGDVQLSMVQKVPVAGAVVVCTPQNVALADVKKSVDMFRRVGVPVLGLVENMSHYRGPSGEKLEMFPRGELQNYLDREKIQLLGSLPFDPRLAKASEIGIPLIESAPADEVSGVFAGVARALASGASTRA